MNTHPKHPTSLVNFFCDKYADFVHQKCQQKLTFRLERTQANWNRLAIRANIKINRRTDYL